MKSKPQIIMFLLMGVTWIANGLIKGWGNFINSLQLFTPGPGEAGWARYTEPTISASELDQMRTGLGGILLCGLGVGFLICALGFFLKDLTEPQAETGSEQAEDTKPDNVTS